MPIAVHGWAFFRDRTTTLSLIVSLIMVIPGHVAAADPDVDADQLRDLRDRIYQSDHLQRDLPPDLGKEGIDVFKPGQPEESAAEDWPEDPTLEEPEEQDEPEQQRSNPDRGQTLTIDSDKARTIFWFILGGLAVVIGFFALRNHLNRSGRSMTSEEGAPAELEEVDAGLQERPSGDTVHDLLLRGIGLLESHGKFEAKPGLTARDILAGATVEGEGREAFAALVRGVEATRFARRPEDQALLNACQAAFAKLRSSLGGITHES